MELYRRELDKTILTNIKQKIINYLRTNGLSNVDEVTRRMDLVSELYVENMVERGGPRMQQRRKTNEITIDTQFVQFDKNQNPTGLKPNLSKLIESQLGHELLHAGAQNRKGTGIMTSNEERGLNEGLTQLITENIFGYTVSNNTDIYRMLKKFAKILEATFGKSCILESYFGDSLELKNRLNGIKPNYYIIFNKCLSMSYYSKKDDNLDKFHELLMRDVVINIVLPTIKHKSPEEANRYLKNIALYFKDDYKTSMDFLGIIEEYKNMDSQTLLNKKTFIERDINKEYTRMEFRQACLKDDADITKLVTIDNKGNVTAHYDGKHFSITDEKTLRVIFVMYYKQVVINDPNRLADINKKIENKISNNDFRIKFNPKVKGNITLKRAALAYYIKVASKSGISVSNSIKDLRDEDEFTLDTFNKNDKSNFDLDELRSMLDKYNLVYLDPNNPQKYEIINKVTKEIVENPRIKKIVSFAYLWLSSFGYRSLPGEKYNGETYAFSEFSHEVYKDMCILIKKSMKEYGTIDVDRLSEELAKGRSFGSVDTPLSVMFKNPQSTEIVYKYFNVLIPKEEKMIETETTKIYNSEMVDYQGVIEARIDSIIPSSNKNVYEELYNELARDYRPGIQVKNNNDYYREFVAITDAVANAISIDNDVLISETMKKLKEAENKIVKVNIKNLDLSKASKDQIIQQSLARMKRALKNRDIDSYNRYRDRYNDIINGKTDTVTYH